MYIHLSLSLCKMNHFSIRRFHRKYPHPVTKAAEANVASVSAGLYLKLHMPDEALKLGRKGDVLRGYSIYIYICRFIFWKNQVGEWFSVAYLNDGKRWGFQRIDWTTWSYCKQKCFCNYRSISQTRKTTRMNAEGRSRDEANWCEDAKG